MVHCWNCICTKTDVRNNRWNRWMEYLSLNERRAFSTVSLAAEWTSPFWHLSSAFLNIANASWANFSARFHPSRLGLFPPCFSPFYLDRFWYASNPQICALSMTSKIVSHTWRRCRMNGRVLMFPQKSGTRRPCQRCSGCSPRLDLGFFQTWRIRRMAHRRVSNR